jgi:hypothetical protein
LVIQEGSDVKSAEVIVNILEAYDLTGSYRAAAQLCGVSHHTVAYHVQRRDEGLAAGQRPARERLAGPFRDKIDEWVDTSKGRIRADRVHDKLVPLGYEGSDRTTRREVHEAKQAWRAGNGRVYRPWTPEPGLWFQFDYGTGPLVAGVATVLFCAWLAWSRFRVVVPIRDKTLPTVIGCVDRTLRAFGGCPTYGLTDNEKTVTVEHVARIPIRHPQIVAAGGHYGLSIQTCAPADPASKGGSEATVRIAKADLVPTDANLLDEYSDFAALEGACAAWCDEVNQRVHRVTRRPPAEMLAEERAWLHPVPAAPYTLAFGVTRRVGTVTPMVQHDWCQYSVPYQLRGQTVWVREDGDDIVVVHVGSDGPNEVARHERTTPGNPRVDDDHFPPAPETALGRTAVARTPEEAEFLALGEGAHRWLTEAGQAGVRRVRAKMAEAVVLAKLGDAAAVDWALGHAAVMGRFADGDVAAILAHRAAAASGPARTADEFHSLQDGTGGWEGFGR